MAKLYFYYAAMNAGKSTVLLQAAYNYEERGMKTILLTPKIDTRYSEGMIHSRIGITSQAHLFDEAINLFTLIEKEQEPTQLACVLIDEAQFLTKAQVWQLTEIVDQLGIPVLTYGLRSDFQGEPFPGSLYLLLLADNLIEIKTICFCGKKATMNLRLDNKGEAIKTGEQIHIGGNDTYLAVCRKHYKQKLKNRL